MKIIPVQDAVGMVLCHDITQIIPGEVKGRAFKKGHIIQKEDIPLLLSLGKENIYVWDLQEGFIHEDEAALRIAKAGVGQGINLEEPKEGKVNLTSATKGLLKVNIDGLKELNSLGEVVFVTLHNNQVVEAGKLLAGTRIIPLVMEEEKVKRIEILSQNQYPIIEVKPLKKHRVGVVTTGSEVYHGRIEDKFGPVIKKKMNYLGSQILEQIIVPDEVDRIVGAIKELLAKGADFIAVTGGMSVDPDDVSPSGIRAMGGEIITYGAPVLPGAMFMLAYLDDIPIVGLPGCVMYHGTTIFDLVVPRLLAGERVNRQDIALLGHGGLCLDCQVCHYPICGFGKGS